MKQEDIIAALEAISKSGINVKGDLVLEKKVDYEVANVEDGGIGIQIINGERQQTAQPDEQATAEANADEEDPPQHAESSEQEANAIASQCFRATSEFVRQRVAEVVKEFFMGSAANLALIEIALFDHRLLKKRNAHKTFVKSLMAWEAIQATDEDELERLVRAVADKHKRMPKEGYRDWSNDYAGDKVFCGNVGLELGDTIPYSRAKNGAF